MIKSSLPNSSSVSLICTVKNEESSIGELLGSLLNQSKLPDEVIIVDGGSTDRTVQIIREYEKQLSIHVIVEKGATIGRGRNLAIRNATSEIIASTDGGCRLDNFWLEKITNPLNSGKDCKVVSGVFVPLCATKTDEIVARTFILPPEKLRAEAFLPSGRSIAFTREAWTLAGGYPEELKFAEDTLFDLKLKQAGCKFLLVRDALVFWKVDPSPKKLLRQFFNYAEGEGEAGLFSLNYALRFGSIVGLALTLWVTLGAVLGVLALAIVVAFGLWLKRLRSLETRSLKVFGKAILAAFTIEVGISLGYLAGLLKRFT